MNITAQHVHLDKAFKSASVCGFVSQQAERMCQDWQDARKNSHDVILISTNDDYAHIAPELWHVDLNQVRSTAPQWQAGYLKINIYLKDAPAPAVAQRKLKGESDFQNWKESLIYIIIIIIIKERSFKHHFFFCEG